jgi:3-carboxy-cis,cis-muconate cycloisomerase
MSVTPFDHPLLRGLLGDEELAELFTAEAEIAEMVRFEVALAQAEASERVIPAAAGAAIATRLGSFKPNQRAMRQATARDGVVGVAFVQQLRAHVGAKHAEFVHFGATSQDVVDTSLVLRLRTVLELLEGRIQTLIAALEHLSARFGGHKIIGRTRMQNAVPITVGTRIETWSAPLGRHLERLKQLRPRLLVLQLGGAAGTLDQLGSKGRRVGARMAKELRLRLPQRSWHTQRDALAELASWLSLVAGTLGKMGQDVALMAQNPVGEIAVLGGGASSAMPHKQNPVRAEVLVALAHYASTLLPGMHQALVAEQERSGAAWTLEWLVLPQMVMAVGVGLRTAIELAGSVQAIGVAHG